MSDEVLASGFECGFFCVVGQNVLNGDPEIKSVIQILSVEKDHILFVLYYHKWGDEEYQTVKNYVVKCPIYNVRVREGITEIVTFNCLCTQLYNPYIENEIYYKIEQILDKYDMEAISKDYKLCEKYNKLCAKYEDSMKNRKYVGEEQYNYEAITTSGFTSSSLTRVENFRDFGYMSEVILNSEPKEFIEILERGTNVENYQNYCCPHSTDFD